LVDVWNCTLVYPHNTKLIYPPKVLLIGLVL